MARNYDKELEQFCLIIDVILTDQKNMDQTGVAQASTVITLVGFFDMTGYFSHFCGWTIGFGDLRDLVDLEGFSFDGLFMCKYVSKSL